MKPIRLAKAEADAISLQPVTYQRLMTAYAKKGKIDRATEMFDKIQSFGIDTTIDVWNTWMRVLKKS
jgi:pentatricopeptide repeat protein